LEAVLGFCNSNCQQQLAHLSLQVRSISAV
jgi:hypothetical protein